ncbi:MAG TPA: DUF2255 family protein [Myxococcota bacterium]|nr:DUF2255 family protein [Myxococcota bacterium]
MRRALLFALLALVALGVVTYIAGEQTEVVRLRTFDEHGEPFETKMWAVDYDGDVFVRVANPQRHWYRRLLANPKAELLRNGSVTPVVAEPSEDPALRAAVDASFHAKYGIVDGWYGVLLRRNPVPVRLRTPQ